MKKGGSAHVLFMAQSLLFSASLQSFRGQHTFTLHYSFVDSQRTSQIPAFFLFRSNLRIPEVPEQKMKSETNRLFRTFGQ